MESRYQIALEYPIWRSALPKLKLSTIPAESNASIVNHMSMSNCEILSGWSHWNYCSKNDTNQCHNFSHHSPSVICHTPHARCPLLHTSYYTPPASRLPVVGGVAERSVSHHHCLSPWQTTERLHVYRDTRMMEIDWAMGTYIDTEVTEPEVVMGSIYWHK